MPRYQYQRSNRNIFIALILLGVLAGIWIGYYVSSQSYQPTERVVTKYVYEPSSISFSQAEIDLAAVDQNGNGVITPLIVQVKSGDGKILTNIEKLLFWVDTQQSIQTAIQVAESVTKIDVNKYDIIYTVESNSTLVGGPSAGAALTVATIAALQKKNIKSDVLMTGTINPDGTIGEVGGVLEKAQAAKALGAKLFLVPKGQGTETYVKPNESCLRQADRLICTIKYNEVTINIGKDAGIEVIEVANVTEAMKYLIS
jgi:uncharacterized protein